LRTTQPP